MAREDIRALLGKYNITEHAKKKKRKKGESFEAQLIREGVITKKKMSLLESVKARRDYINRLATK